jgi:hypothetical protein
MGVEMRGAASAIAASLLMAALPSSVAADGRRAFLDRLVPVILAGVARRDTDHAVFHGSYDWHSSVHAHWAILRLARATGAHAEAADAVERALEDAGLEQETKALREQPQFEMPYGRAWLLCLAIEFERWSGERGRERPRRLRAAALECARSLRAHLEAESPGPDTAEYANASWALLQLHAWYRFTGDEKGVAWVVETVRERFLGASTSCSFALDAARPEFFSRFGNWVLLVATTMDRPALASFLARHPMPPAALVPVRPDGTRAHAFGMNWSRAWSLAALARAVEDPAQREVFRKAHDAHVAAATRDHETFAGDYAAYDHWVPQFAVFALTTDE